MQTVAASMASKVNRAVGRTRFDLPVSSVLLVRALPVCINLVVGVAERTGCTQALLYKNLAEEANTVGHAQRLVKPSTLPVKRHSVRSP
jgi:hypothetical protein